LKRRFRSLVPAALIAAIIALAPTPVQAQDYTWTLSFMGGVGSALREGGGSDGAYQVGFGLQFEPGANVWFHAGELGFETGSSVGELTDGTITYVNVGGEYQFNENYYDSGIFIGLGAYDMESRLVLEDGVLAPASSDTVIGLVLGATGEFKITPSFVFLVEITGHILDSSALRVLGTAHAGFGFHF